MKSTDWLWDLLVSRTTATPDLLVAIDERGAELSFGELRERAEQTAPSLAQLGVGPDVPVVWQLPTWIDALVVMTALSRLGATQVPVLPIYRERELRVVLDQVRPAIVLAPSTWRGFDYAGMYARLTAEEPSRTGTLVTVDRAEQGELPAFTPTPSVAAPATEIQTLDAARPLARDVRWIFFTSGTTADPKGARHIETSVAAGPRSFCERVQLNATDRYPIVFPLTHVGGVGTVYAQMLTGACAVLDEQFDPAQTIDRLAASRITIGAGGTPLVQLYLEHQRRQPDQPLFPDLRLCLTGAAPKHPALHDAVRNELGGRGCISTYGLTEAPFASISALHDRDDDLALTEGRAAAGADIRIVREDGTECPPGQVGEVRIKGPQVCLGYLDSRLDADAFDAHGYFRTGDLGALDARGNLTIRGRMKDVIIRRGENISALEVEDVLHQHPAVREVAVLGLPDERTGERACAFVVVRDSHAPPTLQGLAAFCVDQGLARQKVPEQLEVTDALPRNAAGKVLKHELRARLEGTTAR